MNLNHSYKEEFSKECTTSVIYLSLYILFIGASDFNLKVMHWVISRIIKSLLIFSGLVILAK